MTRTIILIRHAEKLTWPSGNTPEAHAKLFYEDNHQLSAKGFERAHALAGYFLYRPEMRALFSEAPLASVVSQGVDSLGGAGKSFRPKQTVAPLIATLSLPNASRTLSADAPSPCTSIASSAGVSMRDFVKRDVHAMLDWLKTSPDLAGKSAIVSWSHQTLPHLAVSLGVPPEAVPKKWGKRFDVTWVVKITGAGVASLIQLPQNLLFGDENAPIKLKGGFDVGLLQELARNEVDDDAEVDE
ncbi:hypothetical protein BC830DRAFT_1059750 [Chytriomyces sp. MP71]|nr:hypothetical protein BC830DRAFT_1059750 [Chytriomyces sp. MP71]